MAGTTEGSSLKRGKAAGPADGVITLLLVPVDSAAYCWFRYDSLDRVDAGGAAAVAYAAAARTCHVEGDALWPP
jgi:hypothetical protein